MIINLIILFLFLVGLFLSIRQSKEWLSSIDKKEHKLYLLYPLSDWILTRTSLDKLPNRKSNITDSMKALYNTAKPERMEKLFWYDRISLVIMIIFLFNVLSIASQFMGNDDSDLLNGRYLKRPDYGKGSRQVELNVTMKREDTSKKEEESSRKVSIDLKERAYTQKELEVIFKKAFDYLKINALGENESAEEVYHNLYFRSSIPETSVSVEWEPEDYDLIETDGTVCNEGIDEKGITTAVTVILVYQDKKSERNMSFHIMPKQYSQNEILAQRLRQEITKASEKSAAEEVFRLPDSIDHYTLSWRDGKKEKNSGAVLLLFGIVTAAAAWVAGEKELEKRMKQRKEQMLFDYPELVNKFTLLINAGMTIKQAWNKISEDYFEVYVQKKGKKRYAYEEMITTVNEMKLGLPENIAYEQYGRRIGLIPYIKFSSLISQNLRKGNKGFTELMMREAMEAFKERKEAAKRLGEEAGTKLLIPMALMLIMVLLIIMIPAFMVFRM